MFVIYLCKPILLKEYSLIYADYMHSYSLPVLFKSRTVNNALLFISDEQIYPFLEKADFRLKL